MYFYSFGPQFKPRWYYVFLWSLAIILIGVFILVDTHDFAQILAWAAGLFLLFTGVLGIYLYLRSPKNLPISKNMLWQSILKTLVGILAVSLPVVFARFTWITMIYLVAVEFLVSGVIDFSLAWRVQRTGFPLGVSVNEHFSNAFLSFFAAIVLLIAPRFVGLFLLNLIAIVLITGGLLMLIFFANLWWRNKKSGI